MCRCHVSFFISLPDILHKCIQVSSFFFINLIYIVWFLYLPDLHFTCVVVTLINLPDWYLFYLCRSDISISHMVANINLPPLIMCDRTCRCFFCLIVLFLSAYELKIYRVKLFFSFNLLLLYLLCLSFFFISIYLMIYILPTSVYLDVIFSKSFWLTFYLCIYQVDAIFSQSSWRTFYLCKFHATVSLGLIF